MGEGERAFPVFSVQKRGCFAAKIAKADSQVQKAMGISCFEPDSGFGYSRKNNEKVTWMSEREERYDRHFNVLLGG